MIFYPELKNYIQNDPLSDWFEITNRKYNTYTKNKKSSFEIELSEFKYTYKQNFYNFLKSHYHYRFGINLQKEKTHSLIKDKTKDIFIDCELYHKKYDILLKPDLIIHRDVFKKIFKEVNFINLPEYIIADILFKTISFNADKTDILNDDNIYYHKCKMLLCNESIHNKSKYGFLFAKKYLHNDIQLNKSETIGYFKFNNDIKTKVKKALTWIDDLNKYYDEWLIYPKPTIKELYPNMNIKIGCWYNEKKLLAELIKEITLVWNISYNKRCLLHDRGITTWDDPILLNNIYPYNIRENKRELIQERMIHINRQSVLKIHPRKIKNREFINHIIDKKDSIILDIESVISFDEYESYFNDINNEDKPRICIIGTITNHNKTFKDFTIKYLDINEEKKIIKYWLLYLQKTLKTDIIKVYHWGNAEKVYIDYMKQKYNDLKFPQFIMIDLLSYFKNEPITIQGCFGYGLKEIVKQLYNHNLIKNQWTDDTDGLEAMMQFIKKSPLAESKNIPLKRYTEIKNIIYYNYMDCRVIVDILEMLKSMI